MAAALMLAAFAVCMAASPSHAAAAERQPCAATAQARALDFWLGKWTVIDGEQPSHASSVVSLELGKCLVVEHWRDAAGHRGENLFGFNLDSRTWNGMFADNHGRFHIFDHGTVMGGKAQLYGQSQGSHGGTILNRITIARMAPNHIEQTWQQSADHGATWATVFKGSYSRMNP
jgi:hypothetical protein